jgi:hypothetical protein
MYLVSTALFQYTTVHVYIDLYICNTLAITLCVYINSR